MLESVRWVCTDATSAYSSLASSSVCASVMPGVSQEASKHVCVEFNSSGKHPVVENKVIDTHNAYNMFYITPVIYSVKQL